MFRMAFGLLFPRYRSTIFHCRVSSIFQKGRFQKVSLLNDVADLQREPGPVDVTSIPVSPSPLTGLLLSRTRMVATVASYPCFRGPPKSIPSGAQRHACPRSAVFVIW